MTAPEDPTTHPDEDLAEVPLEEAEERVGEVTNPVDDTPEVSPFAPAAAFMDRHRLVLGIALAVVFLALTALALVALRPENQLPGFAGAVQRFAFPVMTALIAAVGLTWGLRLRRRWTNLAAYLAIGTYLFYLATGWVYDQFIA